MPLLSVFDQNQKGKLFYEENKREKLAESPIQQLKWPDFKVYNDDEPLACLTSKARFNSIPESDENCDVEFQGFWINGGDSCPVDNYVRDAALITASRQHDKYAVVLKVKAPAVPEKAQRRFLVDLAMTVLDGTPNSKDAVRKAVKVLLDRREKNIVGAVILLSDFLDQSSSVS
ncbi:hypothetical protein L1987_78544 [Smallanthus sonchifolius]|uniref:Uncharacterized protein n=1 Tax=Smallanthus sonchifolius TaxID=185202 RepID=A0ACB8ZD71_9ASTR|nr:hypothetical protein L1987_78544 [Smallanthus sonchifolius]